jgi:pyruvate formate lyase activating enzyme
MTDRDYTPADTLMWACQMGREKGLHYVYAGNLPGEVGNLENTYCHNCRALLVERFGYKILQLNVSADGTCPKCATSIPGRWGDPTQHQARWHNRFVTPL